MNLVLLTTPSTYSWKLKKFQKGAGISTFSSGHSGAGGHSYFLQLVFLDIEYLYSILIFLGGHYLF